jgi:hypothetical protein
MAEIASCDHYPNHAIFQKCKGQAAEICDKNADTKPLFWGIGVGQHADEIQGNRQSHFLSARRHEQILTTYNQVS